MNWEAIGAIGEIVGAVAVVGTLAYLAVQIRQNTAESRNNTYQQLLSQRATLNMTIAGGELASVWRRGFWEQETLTADEAMQFNSMLLQLMAFLRAGHKMLREGTLDQDDWAEMAAILGVVKGCPGFVNWWEEGAQFYDPAFVRMVEETDAVDPLTWDDEAKRFTNATETHWRART